VNCEWNLANRVGSGENKLLFLWHVTFFSYKMSEKAKRDGSPTRKPKKKPVEEVKTVEAPKAKRKPSNANASKAIEQEVRISTAIMLLKKGHADLALEVLTTESSDEQAKPKRKLSE
jgi:hypothetical protein